MVPDTVSAIDPEEGELTIDLELDTTDLGPCSYAINLTWSASDSCGNSTSASHQVEFIDTIPPVVIPGDSLAPLNGDSIAFYNCDVPFFSLQDFEFDDCCPMPSIFTFSKIIYIGDCDGFFDYIRRWQMGFVVSDSAGNETTYSWDVYSFDTVPPRPNVVPEDLAVPCDSLVSDAPEVIFYNDCRDVETTYAEIFLGDTASGSFGIERSWQAADSCGNDAMVSQFISVCGYQQSTANDLQDSNIPMSIYPNPARNEIWIESETDYLKYYRIVDCLGRVVLQSRQLDISHKHRVDVSDLSSGYYHIISQSRSHTLVSPVLIRK